MMNQKIQSSLSVLLILVASSVTAFVVPPIGLFHTQKQNSFSIFMADEGAPAAAAAEEKNEAIAPNGELRQANSSRQQEYGVSLELPSTYVKCGQCDTAYAITEDDLGIGGRGRRLECCVCGHTWFQSRDRIAKMSNGFEMVTLPEADLERINLNIKEGKSPKFVGDIKLYIGNISYDSTEDDVAELFNEVGEVGAVSLVVDDLGRNRGFGFVTMRTVEDGEKAIDTLDGRQLGGRSLTVRESNS